MIGERAVRAAAKLWYVKVLNDNAAVPVPHDGQRVVSGDDDADQVLLIGNGPTHGWGTVTHELALTGQLARACTRRTGRAVDIDYVGDETMNLAAVLPWLGAKPVADFDLVLLVLSMNDAVRLTGVDGYRADMERLLDKLQRELKPSARVVVAGIHPVRSFPSYTGVFAALGQRNADRLNATVRELVGRYDGVAFIDLGAPDPEPGRPYGSPHMYAEWAEQFADTCAEALDTNRALETEARHAPADQTKVWDWAPGEHIIDGAPEGGWDHLEHLVGDAKQQFGVDMAFVSLLDGDRQYYAAISEKQGAMSVPREITHCDVTIRGSEPLIVKNSFKDDRFKDSPLIDILQMQYYAGVPLQSADGRNIGTFCVMSVFPRSSKAVSEPLLKQYAAKAQAELQRIAAEAETPAVETVREDGLPRL